MHSCELVGRFKEVGLAQYLFEDEVSVRPLDEVTDPILLDEVTPVRNYQKSSGRSTWILQTNRVSGDFGRRVCYLNQDVRA
jgi:hypothetical protein